ncbi:MAG: LysM peptidoglycan-binding domain-containing protein [Bacteroidetes bacterium]|nr:LysM peptidoglycan-binding domain-containing protein [Bacteroidota bacterium]
MLLFLLLQFPLQGQNGNKLTRDTYIQTYAELAMKEMARVGIPASITLAQGCLESNNGNSTLARKGNNHFGIKCHEWTGRKIYHDDDARHECFRSYDSPYESYMDHSLFLTTKTRYASLFELKPHDYRGWAKGLKKAGYATASKYATLLIQIIEQNELYRYDLLVLEGGMGSGTDSTTFVTDHGYRTSRSVLVNNTIEYIVVEPGDTPESIRDEMDLYHNELYRYNSLYKGEVLVPGQIIYLQPKRRKAARGNEIHVVKEGETMYTISQIYGVKLKHLYRLNLMSEGAQPLAGIEIYLRRKKREPLLKLEPVEEPVFEDEMQFRFEE